MPKYLEYKMLTYKEKAEYMTLVNVPTWAERADRYEEKAQNPLKFILTGGLSFVINQALSLFTAIRGSAGDVSQREALAKFLIRAARKHGCSAIDRSKFPSVERWGWGVLNGIEPVNKLLLGSRFG
jgi:hypothetical protein